MPKGLVAGHSSWERRHLAGPRRRLEASDPGRRCNVRPLTMHYGRNAVCNGQPRQ